MKDGRPEVRNVHFIHKQYYVPHKEHQLERRQKGKRITYRFDLLSESNKWSLKRKSSPNVGKSDWGRNHPIKTFRFTNQKEAISFIVKKK